MSVFPNRDEQVVGISPGLVSGCECCTIIHIQIQHIFDTEMSFPAEQLAALIRQSQQIAEMRMKEKIPERSESPNSNPASEPVSELFSESHIVSMNSAGYPNQILSVTDFVLIF